MHNADYTDYIAYKGVDDWNDHGEFISYDEFIYHRAYLEYVKRRNMRNLTLKSMLLSVSRMYYLNDNFLQGSACLATTYRDKKIGHLRADALNFSLRAAIYRCNYGIEELDFSDKAVAKLSESLQSIGWLDLDTFLDCEDTTVKDVRQLLSFVTDSMIY